MNNSITPWPYPLWIAHRGAGTLAPENTMSAFERGASLGYKMFECDVKLTQDGVPFLLHDANLERTTSGHGAVLNKTWLELSTLDAGGWYSEVHKGEPLVTMEALFAWCKQHRLLLNLELKPVPGQDEVTARVVAKAILEQWPRNLSLPLLSSFSPICLRVAQATAPQIPRALLLENFQSDWRQTVAEIEAVAVVANWRVLSPYMMREIKASDLRVLSYTVNDPQIAAVLLKNGIDGLITDRIDLFSPDLKIHSESR